MRCGLLVVFFMNLVVLTNCATRKFDPVESLLGGQDVSRFVITSISGTRNGDRLDVRAVYGDGTRGLRVDLSFKVGVPTRLERGTWSGLEPGGNVQERSVTFLGGQNGPPSIGGRFDLIGPDNKAYFRISIPLQPLKDRL